MDKTTSKPSKRDGSSRSSLPLDSGSFRGSESWDRFFKPKEPDEFSCEVLDAIAACRKTHEPKRTTQYGTLPSS